MKQTLILYLEEHPFLVALVFISLMMLAFAPISASQGAYVDYTNLTLNIIALWFITGIAFFINRKW
ncbi:MAG: hypothetical protein U9P44_02690 [archaeon]|nr:hypothetical protein [archaeon]